jgi:hypothetical protein
LPEGLTCASCHNLPNFVPVREDMEFDHGEVAGFPLLGAHARAGCRGCHLDLRFTEMDIIPEDCSSCHADLHQSRFVDPCVVCHQPTSFRDVSGLDIHNRTTFPLVGAHQQITCEACHTTDESGGAFAAQDTECIACHLEDYETAANVDHVANDFPGECTGCHSVLAFADGPPFPHLGSGSFALSGPHTTLRCESCHTVPGLNVRYPAGDPQECIACHQTDYDAQHGGSNFPTSCLTCHSGEAWENPIVDHTAVTGFELRPPHDGLDCSACHEGTAFTLRFPVPASSADCGACHQAADHVTLSGGFELVGVHAGAECTACHESGTMELKFSVPDSPDDCVTCHLADFEAAHTPNWSRNCVVCHTPTSWTGAAPTESMGVRRAP